MTDEGRNTSATEFAALLDLLADTPNQIENFTTGLTDTELRLQSSPGEFSVVENVCHLRDLELQGYTTRIRRILSETEPALPDFDGAWVAAKSAYNNEQLDNALRAFQQARRENVATLRSLTEAQLQSAGILEGVGRVTLERLAEMMREHDEGHLEDLRVLSQRLKRNAAARSGDAN
jgi:hypothetical protein